MSTGEAGDHIEDHGKAMDEEKKRVVCNYCGKEVRGFNRLKHHLAGLGNDVASCVEVSADIRAHMRDALLEKKKERLLKEVGEIYHPDLPLKRNFVTTSAEVRRSQLKPTPSTTPGKASRVMEDGSEDSANEIGGHPEPSHPVTLEKGKNVAEPTAENVANGSVPSLCLREDVKTIVKLETKEEVKGESMQRSAKCIGRFFFEAGIDPSGIKLPSFQRMIDSVMRCGPGYEVPTYDELRGRILQEELQEVCAHVEDVKCSWVQMGCSILLDGWTDQRGRNLLAFLVDCPKGTVFLRSVDASYAAHDIDALFLLFSRVIEEVGVNNVVQVIAHDTSCYMEAVGKRLLDKYKTMFWTLCADHCMNLILQKIEMIDQVNKVLAEAKTITKFIYSHALPLELMKCHIRGGDLVKASKLKSVADFLTLENIVSQKENLVTMFNTPAWNASVWASRAKGKAVTDLVKDSSFWAAADDVLKITTPIVSVLHQINKGDAAPMGFLYDAMDRAKEGIKKNLGGEESSYLPVWIIIDEIWDNYLHSPLHSAGYYLNPGLFYSNDFFVDAEVTNGLLCCIVRLVENRNDQDLIVRQLDAYRAPIGALAEEIAVDQRTKLPPATWWTLFGGQSHELQTLAVKILSQTCSGTSRYKLRRTLSEQLHAKGRNCIDQQRFCDMEFVHNNLQLWHSPWNRDRIDSISHEEISPLDDWIVEGSC